MFYLAEIQQTQLVNGNTIFISQLGDDVSTQLAIR